MTPAMSNAPKCAVTMISPLPRASASSMRPKTPGSPRHRASAPTPLGKSCSADRRSRRDSGHSCATSRARPARAWIAGRRVQYPRHVGNRDAALGYPGIVNERGQRPSERQPQPIGEPSPRASSPSASTSRPSHAPRTHLCIPAVARAPPELHARVRPHHTHLPRHTVMHDLDDAHTRWERGARETRWRCARGYSASGRSPTATTSATAWPLELAGVAGLASSEYSRINSSTIIRA